MTRLLPAILLIVLYITIPAHSAEVKSELGDKHLYISIQFEKGYSNVRSIKLDNSYIISFDTAEDIEYSEDFWDSPVDKAYIKSDGTRKKLIVDFERTLIEPDVLSNNGKLTVSFPLEGVQTADGEGNQEINAGSYLRIVTGLIFVVIMILVIFWMFKSFMKRKVFSDIPGSGRLLGKADLEIRKSLYFYELGNALYIMGVTDMGINLVDKITDEEEIEVIKAGFSRKTEFSSYFNFFKKGGELKADIDVSRNQIKEKLKSLRER
ncbi:FliO/MopB family protein [Limisalsivibrio acetivorans]|uniref:FliO/MopB family protein n=1 Tax=Limisalsivibrio acetivorans TaxID=1304888 RepID=UPI0003B5A9C4|nr:hypothetical protein [Limisalsivibrio acetivorans]